jgi:AcrR family transcriptional regulator
MAPPRNTRRRNALADAAIEVLGTAGIHRLSHRAVDERASLPAGTAANYFPRRDDLLAAAAARVAELHLTEMTATDRAAAGQGTSNQGATNQGTADQGTADQVGGPGGQESDPVGRNTLARLIGKSLYEAVSQHRTRYLAAYELALESTRQPELAAAMSRLGAAAMGTTLAEHRSLGLPTTPEQVHALIALYNGTLLTLIVAPPGTITEEIALALASSLVTGVLMTVPGAASSEKLMSPITETTEES